MGLDVTLLALYIDRFGLLSGLSLTDCQCCTCAAWNDWIVGTLYMYDLFCLDVHVCVLKDRYFLFYSLVHVESGWVCHPRGYAIHCSSIGFAHGTVLSPLCWCLQHCLINRDVHTVSNHIKCFRYRMCSFCRDFIFAGSCQPRCGIPILDLFFGDMNNCYFCFCVLWRAKCLVIAGCPINRFQFNRSV